jgi:lipoprotein-anchoring transpeptidase ErfK/SrfK
MRRSRSIALVLSIAPLALGAGSDPGLLIEVDRSTYQLTSRDLRDAVAGPDFSVAVGSPARRTPEGRFPLHRVVHDPDWRPGEKARRLGLDGFDPSPDGPMGIAKLPFAPGGYALHGGGHRAVLGKPVSAGCVRAADEDLAALLAWLAERGALGDETSQADGERHQAFVRPARIEIR